MTTSQETVDANLDAALEPDLEPALDAGPGRAWPRWC